MITIHMQAKQVDQKTFVADKLYIISYNFETIMITNRYHELKFSDWKWIECEYMWVWSSDSEPRRRCENWLLKLIVWFECLRLFWYESLWKFYKFWSLCEKPKSSRMKFRNSSDQPQFIQFEPFDTISSIIHAL